MPCRSILSVYTVLVHVFFELLLRPFCNFLRIWSCVVFLFCFQGVVVEGGGSKGVLLVVYFLRFMTLVHISIRPALASLSGKKDIASMALSTYSWARARVCWRPVLLETISRACVGA